ncbi:MAG: helix-turn-helix domain-containing protein, partial [Gemmatimonadota bacterium]|nr:helix-turn-helix domain-containing protein [Gemmatimonadota bacterium]
MSDLVFLTASPGDLLPWVHRVWYSRGYLTALRETVLPAAATDVVANLGPAMRLIRGTGLSEFTGTVVSGLMSRPFLLEHPVYHEAVGIQLTPHGMRAVLGVPAGEAKDRMVPLEGLTRSGRDELFEVCSASSSPLDRLNAAIKWVRGRVNEYPHSGDPMVRWATGEIDTARGRIGIRDLQGASGYGATRFNQRFVDELGVTPKHYARLARFRATLNCLRPGRDLGRLAADLGYSDQSHMNREF